MSDFEKGAARLAAARRARELDGPRLDDQQLAREALTGARFRPGDRVLDKVTGGYGYVVATRFVTHVAPAPGRGPAGGSSDSAA